MYSRLHLALLFAASVFASSCAFIASVISVKSPHGSKFHATSIKEKSTSQCFQVEVDPSGDDSWKLSKVIDVLEAGGLGILPTDTCYVFCCDIHSRRGVDRIFQLKQYVGKRKPLSLLCKDISTVSKHSDGIDKDLFKTMKKAFPGPYTFILPATHQVPRVLLDHKKHKKTWKRREIGVRIPDNQVLRAVLDKLSCPLICSSVPMLNNKEVDDGDDELVGTLWSKVAEARLARDPQLIADQWSHSVDFIVNAGIIESKGVTTVINCMVQPPEVIRQGMGDISVLD